MTPCGGDKFHMSCLNGHPFTAAPCIDYIDSMSRPSMIHSLLLSAEPEFLFQRVILVD